MYSSLGFGAGNAVGSLYSGYLWDTAGPTATYLVASVISVAALFVALRWVRLAAP